MYFGCRVGAVSDVLDAGLEMLPAFELAAVPVLDGTDRPGEWPAVRRRLRAEGIRFAQNRGVLLFPPGELDQCATVGLFRGFDEIYLCAEWNEELRTSPRASPPTSATSARPLRSGSMTGCWKPGACSRWGTALA